MAHNRPVKAETPSRSGLRPPVAGSFSPSSAPQTTGPKSHFIALIVAAPRSAKCALNTLKFIPKLIRFISLAPKNATPHPPQEVCTSTDNKPLSGGALRSKGLTGAKKDPKTAKYRHFSVKFAHIQAKTAHFPAFHFSPFSLLLGSLFRLAVPALPYPIPRPPDLRPRTPDPRMVLDGFH